MYFIIKCIAYYQGETLDMMETILVSTYDTIYKFCFSFSSE